MKKILLITLVLGISNLKAKFQHQQLQLSEIQTNIKDDPTAEKLNKIIINQQNAISQLSIELKQKTIQLSNLERDIDSLNIKTETNRRSIKSLAGDLGNKIQNTGKQAESQISALGGDVEKNRLYWIIATLLTVLLGILMYLFLGRRIKSSQTDVEIQINNTKRILEEEGLKLDSELIKVFQKQLKVIENAGNSITPEDHSLVLKIADRLTAMETNLYRMDPNTRGLNNLKNLVKSTKENFNAKEYEIVEMLGKEYKEGMEVIATFIPSDEIEIGKQIITRVIKPQVNYKGKTIQAAQIEVSIGE